MKRRLPALGIGALAGAGVYLALRRVPRTDKPESGERTIVCIGDSITYGAGVKRTRRSDAWPYVLNRRLGGDCCVLNYGVSGATARDDGDFPYRGHGYLPEAEKAGAELALLMLGTNDSKPYNWDKDGYERDILLLIGELRICCGQLVLLLPPKAFPASPRGSCPAPSRSRSSWRISARRCWASTCFSPGCI